MFFTKLLKIGAAQINNAYPYKLFKAEGYEVLLRKPEFLYYHKESDGLTLSLFKFNHPMSAAIRGQAPAPFPMSNGQQPFSKLTAYVDLEFRYQPRKQIGLGDPMIRDILQAIQKAKEQWAMEIRTGASAIGSTTTAVSTTATAATTPSNPEGHRGTDRTRTREDNRTDRKRHHPDLRHELERRTEDKGSRTYKMRPN